MTEHLADFDARHSRYLKELRGRVRHAARHADPETRSWHLRDNLRDAIDWRVNRYELASYLIDRGLYALIEGVLAGDHRIRTASATSRARRPTSSDG